MQVHHNLSENGKKKGQQEVVWQASKERKKEKAVMVKSVCNVDKKENKKEKGTVKEP